jgi:hypothetical protein
MKEYIEKMLAHPDVNRAWQAYIRVQPRDMLTPDIFNLRCELWERYCTLRDRFLKGEIE